jgi:hypothetical protein
MLQNIKRFDVAESQQLELLLTNCIVLYLGGTCSGKLSLIYIGMDFVVGVIVSQSLSVILRSQRKWNMKSVPSLT